MKHYITAILSIIFIISCTPTNKPWYAEYSEMQMKKIEKEIRKEKRLNRLGRTIDKIDFVFPKSITVGDYVFSMAEPTSTYIRRYECERPMDIKFYHRVKPQVERLYKDKRRRCDIEMHCAVNGGRKAYIEIKDKWLESISKTPEQHTTYIEPVNIIID